MGIFSENSFLTIHSKHDKRQAATKWPKSQRSNESLLQKGSGCVINTPRRKAGLKAYTLCAMMAIMPCNLTVLPYPVILLSTQLPGMPFDLFR